MNVHVRGAGRVARELRERVERAGHALTAAAAGADTIVDFEPREPLECPPHALVLASCHAQPAERIAARARHGERVVGFSVLPPLEDGRVVELAAPLRAAPGAMLEARAFVATLALEPLEVPDGPGLVSARVVACLANEAFSALQERVADARTIDTAMRLGTNYPRGPFEWAELTGLEFILEVMEGLFAEYGEDRYRPHPLLRRLVTAGASVAAYEARLQDQQTVKEVK